MNITQALRSYRLRLPLLVFGIIFATWVGWQSHDKNPALQPPQVVATASQKCTEIRPAFGPYQEAIIEKSGRNCIATDFWQRRLSDFAGHTGPAPYRHLLAVMADDVIVEMANRTLHTDGNSSGIVAVRIQEGEMPVPKNITIKNGVLDIRGLGEAVRIVDHWPMYDINAPVPADFPGFRKAGIVLENLLIKTDNVGVMLEGDGNIIRNYIIESGGDSAIMMAGPNGQILNNRIVLTEPFVPTWLKPRGYIEQLMRLHEFRQQTRAAIVLHRANGTVIRGNRIEVEGKSSIRHNIYLTDASIGVRVEGNTIVGLNDPVTIRNGSTAELRDNIFEQSKPWWKP